MENKKPATYQDRTPSSTTPSYQYEQDFRYNDETKPQSTLPTIAGIVLIITSFLIIFHWIYLLMNPDFILSNIDFTSFTTMNVTITPEQIVVTMNMCGTISILLSIFTLLAGIFALQKKMFGVVLSGCVLGIIALAPLFLFIPNFLAICCLILLIISRKNFF
ncbi:MAG: hypothetical protein V1726_07710 [Methanobacteriota archaeon]